MKSVSFVAAARHEFLAEVAYYNRAQDGLGARFTAAVEEASARALTFPEAGTFSKATNTRRVMLKGFPFFLHYRITEEGIVVFAVANQARQPGYWEDRSNISKL